MPYPITLITNTRTIVLSFDDEDVRDYVVSCVRELMIQEQHHAHLAGASAGRGVKRPSLQIVAGEDVSKEMAHLIAQNKTLQQRVTLETQNYQKTMSQFLEVNNDYNEKQHHNKTLLKEREGLQQALAAKDKLFKEVTMPHPIMPAHDRTRQRCMAYDSTTQHTPHQLKLTPCFPTFAHVCLRGRLTRCTARRCSPP